MKHYRRWFRPFVVLVAIALWAGAGCQSSFVYYPDRAIVRYPNAYGLAYESITLTTADRVRINAWWVPAGDGAPVALFFHGNAGNNSHRADHLALFHRMGVSVFIVDYRGFGKSEGSPSERGTYEDARAAWAYLTKERGIAPGRIVVFGQSLGGSVAAWLAREAAPGPGALILDSTFTAIADVARQSCLYYPLGWIILTYRYDTRAYVKGARCPVMVIHSREDELIHFSKGQRLYAEAPGPKRFLEIRGSHNTGFITSMREYERGIRDFIETYVGIKKRRTAVE
ncbi:MAG TPA: alpha/beta hydrolase [Spirochaetota bacterium]|nr:alpha/beta hydrolase [Spirochaetota bacterium]HPI22421.1 alpha/beta hydrolase [Spirochaetota bacterium]HPU88322.1 alpha/beta hydrolase [Spirochaetota bacterium]